ncbi:MAG: ABC transporter substrate-binding protein [Alphaproteobacteria bacterium]|nr:ABC transporter substrate-binding protein [Alphaproteobacteria bacterium]
MSDRRVLSCLLGVVAALGIMAPAQSQDARETLRVAMYTQTNTLGHVYGPNYIWPHMYWWEGSYDAFVRVDDKGQVQPFAIERWENVNPTTWRVTFRNNVTFWNGRTNDAANIGKIFEYLMTETGKAAGVLRAAKFSAYKVVGPQTLELVTPEPDPIFIPKLAAFYVIDMAAFNEMGVTDFSVKPVASGPFRVTKWDNQEQTSVAFDKSWRPAKIKNMRILHVPEAATRLASLQAGEIDVAYNMGPDDVPRIRAAGHTAAIESAPFVASIGLFTVDFAKKWPNGKTPFADKRVRQAANLALNKDALVGQLLGGLGKAAGQPAVPSTFGYNPDVKPYPFDPERAKRLLAEAGYGSGVNLLMETSAVFGAAGDVFQVIASDLGKVGFNVTVQVLPFAERSRKFFGNSWAGDLTSFTSFFSPPQDASIPFSVFGCDLPNTFTCIPELTPLIQAQAKEMDRGKRLAQLQELMKRANEEALALYLFEGFDITGIAKRVGGYKNWNKAIHYESMTIGG